MSSGEVKLLSWNDPRSGPRITSLFYDVRPDIPGTGDIFFEYGLIKNPSDDKYILHGRVRVYRFSTAGDRIDSRNMPSGMSQDGFQVKPVFLGFGRTIAYVGKESFGIIKKWDPATLT